MSPIMTLGESAGIIIPWGVTPTFRAHVSKGHPASVASTNVASCCLINYIQQGSF